MVEQRRGVIPPQPRRRAATPHGVIVRRRLVAVGVLVAALIGVGFAIASVHGGGGKQTTTGLVAPKPFRIIFPEGFTREDMAHRVADVSGIAKRERGKQPSHSALLAPLGGIERQRHCSLRDRLTIMAAVAPQIRRSFQLIS